MPARCGAPARGSMRDSIMETRGLTLGQWPDERGKCALVARRRPHRPRRAPDRLESGHRRPPEEPASISVGSRRSARRVGLPSAAAPWATNPSTTLAETTPASATAAPVEPSRAQRERLLFEVAHVLIAPDGEEAAPGSRRLHPKGQAPVARRPISLGPSRTCPLSSRDRGAQKRHANDSDCVVVLPVQSEPVWARNP